MYFRLTSGILDKRPVFGKRLYRKILACCGAKVTLAQVRDHFQYLLSSDSWLLGWRIQLVCMSWKNHLTLWQKKFNLPQASTYAKKVNNNIPEEISGFRSRGWTQKRTLRVFCLFLSRKLCKEVSGRLLLSPVWMDQTRSWSATIFGAGIGIRSLPASNPWYSSSHLNGVSIFHRKSIYAHNNQAMGVYNNHGPLCKF